VALRKERRSTPVPTLDDGRWQMARRTGAQRASPLELLNGARLCPAQRDQSQQRCLTGRVREIQRCWLSDVLRLVGDTAALRQRNGIGGRGQMARRAGALRRQMPDRKVWPGRGWPAAKTSTPQGAGEWRGKKSRRFMQPDLLLLPSYHFHCCSYPF